MAFARRLSSALLQLAVIGISLLGAARVDAQSIPPARVRIFLDCEAPNCNSTEFRTNIGFVDWVNERSAADVHVLITAQNAGTGRQYSLDFIGQGEFAAEQVTLRHTANSSDTEDETLNALTDVLSAGLVGFVAQRGYASQLDIRSAAVTVARPTAPAGRDPWNLWVLGFNGNFFARGEEREIERRFGFGANANRTTDDWKLSAMARINLNRREVELNSGATFVTKTDDWNSAALIVRSITDHVSVGSQFELNRNRNRNRDRGGRVASAIEWSLFPYEEANRRQLVVHHQIGVTNVDYRELTIFQKMDDTYADQRIAMSYDTRQPWGSIYANADFTHLLRDIDQHSYAAGGGFNFRVLRGLDLNMNARYEVLRDQIHLAARGLSDEDILVQQGDLATGYEYQMSMGFNYRFGSIFNNIVNNRFPGSVRGQGGGPN